MRRGQQNTSNLQLWPVRKLLLQPKRTRRPHPQVPHLHLWDLSTHFQDSTGTRLPQGHHAWYHTKEFASKAPWRRGDGMRMETQNNGGRSAKRIGPVERSEGHGNLRKVGWLLGSMDSSTVTRRRERKRQKEERTRHKRRSWSSSWRWQGQRSRLCEIGRRQQYGSNLCTFQKGAQESRRGRRQINKITANTCIFFQDCKVQLIPSFFTFRCTAVWKKKKKKRFN